MITRVNPLGHISLTNDYFSGLVAEAAKNRYGIAAMCRSADDSRVIQDLRELSKLAQEGRLVITLHIKVGYGLNIASITQSITHRVKDEVEHATGLKVARIDVFVDDIIDE